MENEYNYIKGIYDRAMEERSEREREISENIQKEMNDNFWKYVPARLERLVKSVLAMRESGKYTESQIQEAETRVSSTISMVNMYSLPEVITHLTAELAREKTLEKLKLDEQ